MWPALLLLALLCGRARAQDDDVDTVGCAMRGVCRREGELHQNCVYEGGPLPADDIGMESRYQELCPHLFEGAFPRPGRGV